MEKRRGVGRWVRYAWEVVVLATATGLGLVVPLRLVEASGAQPLGAGAQLWTTVVFVADLLLLVRSGRATGERAPLRWLAADAVAALPLAPLFGVPALALFRLLKLLRVIPVARALTRNVTVHPTVPRFGVFLFALGLTAHWLACGWVLLEGAAIGGGPAGYLDGLYWAVTTLTTVGYGDVTPVTTGQTVYAMGAMLLGVGLYGFVIGNLATLLTRMDLTRSEHVAALDRLAGFMRYRRVPRELQRDVYEYYDYLWEHRLAFDEQVLFRQVTGALRSRLAAALRSDLVEELELLDGASKELMRDLCVELRPVVATPGEVIVRAGDPGRHVYFVNQGRVRVEDAEGRMLNDLGDGDFFGELALLTDEPRSATVRAVGYCQLYSLDREAFRRCLTRDPDFARRVERVAEERSAALEDRGRRTDGP